jgi:hypothetical protein
MISKKTLKAKIIFTPYALDTRNKRNAWLTEPRKGRFVSLFVPNFAPNKRKLCRGYTRYPKKIGSVRKEI